MRNRNFRQMLEKKWGEGKFVSVGLDSDSEKIPRNEPPRADGYGPRIIDVIVAFNRAIVEATKDLVCAYKPNLAFYISHGADGIDTLLRTITDIRNIAPDVPVILDAKFADIGNTNAGYVEFAFEYLGVDAITVHPYLGREALQPFLDCKDKGVFVLCRTSNPGAGEFQDQQVLNPIAHDRRDAFIPLYQYVAYRVAREWNKNGNCGLVVGATYPNELCEVRGLVGDMPILIPGVGAQGGDIEKTVKAGKDSRGQGMIINSSRGIIFASNGPDFADAARRATLKLHTLINQYRKEI